MASAGFKQDMPPPGGYSKIHVGRVPPKQLFSTPALFAGFFGVTIYGSYMIFREVRRRRLLAIERYDALIALEPVLVAERDREFLKQIRRNRDEEAKLMKNVEGWKVGTFYGEPIYKTVPKNTFIEPIVNEYYAHNTDSEKDEFLDFRLWY